MVKKSENARLKIGYNCFRFGFLENVDTNDFMAFDILYLLINAFIVFHLNLFDWIYICFHVFAKTAEAGDVPKLLLNLFWQSALFEQKSQIQTFFENSKVWTEEIFEEKGSLMRQLHEQKQKIFWIIFVNRTRGERTRRSAFFGEKIYVRLFCILG